jgi:glucose-6-phosphate isomerase
MNPDDNAPEHSTSITASSAWKDLLHHAERWKSQSVREAFVQDPERFRTLSLRWDDWLLDLSKQRWDRDVAHRLAMLWYSADIPQWIRRMRNGEDINHTEGRAALHIALRAPAHQSVLHHGRDVVSRVHASLAQMEHFVEDLHQNRWLGATGQRITDVVNIGIGGSDLGPRMATQALSAFARGIPRVHYVANLDGTDLEQTLAALHPESTLFIVASKTFTTQETMHNARSARDWLTNALGESAVARHFVAVSTNLTAVAQFGIHPENVHEFWDWVGGRFSLWSAIGLPLACAIGFAHFRALLDGGHAMDTHFFTAPPLENWPGLLGLTDIWNTNFLGAPTRALLPYSHALALLPRYLQQLDMESNGKQVDREGHRVNYATSPIIWGEPGTNGQHAFYQLIHQGGPLIPCEFIACAQPDHSLPGHHEALLANCFAQSEALMQGKTLEEVRLECAHLPAAVLDRLAPYKVFPGNQPSTTLLMPALTPRTLGALIALYEHRAFVCACVWNINPFDQWGVEYGKQLAGRLLPLITRERPLPDALNASTAGLITACHALQKAP